LCILIEQMLPVGNAESNQSGLPLNVIVGVVVAIVVIAAIIVVVVVVVVCIRRRHRLVKTGKFILFLHIIPL